MGLAWFGLSTSVRTDTVLLTIVYALLGVSLYIPLRYTEQISLAYAGYLGIGAYSFALASGAVDGIWGIGIGVAVSVAIGSIVAIATRRLSGYFVAVATMLVAIALIRLFISARAITGGPTGISFETQVLTFEMGRRATLGVSALWLAAVMLLVDRFGRSRLGSGLILMGEHEDAAESLGLHPPYLKATALALGAGIAATAGSILAMSRGFILPDSFTLGVSFLALFAPIIGGMRSAWGCLAGAFAIVYVQNQAGDFGPARLMFGIGVLATLLLFKGGILGGLGLAVDSVWDRIQQSRLRFGPSLSTTTHQEAELELAPQAPFSDRTDSHPHIFWVHQHHKLSNNEYRALGNKEPILVVDQVSKHFGGLVALRDVHLSVSAGEILGVVGPNGAGKTTLMDVITGHQLPDGGKVTFRGSDLRAWSPSRRAGGGVSRTFQHPKLSDHLTISQNVELGLLRSRAARSYGDLLSHLVESMFRGQLSEEDSVSLVADACNRFGLADPGAKVSEASYGTEKLTEIARAVVHEPRLLILDEPFAGLNHTEITMVAQALRALKLEGAGVVVVDHNVDVVRDIADRITVLAQGSVIFDGNPAAALSDPTVREAYFGEIAHA